jgi:hypothetical protein
MLHDYVNIIIQIPNKCNKVFNEGFSLEENYVMLEIGSTAIRSIRQELSSIKEEDKENMKQEIEQFYKKEINELTFTNQIIKQQSIERLEEQKRELYSKMEEINQLKIDFEKEKIQYKLNMQLEEMRSMNTNAKEINQLKLQLEQEKQQYQMNLHLEEIKQMNKHSEEINNLKTQLDNEKQQYQTTIAMQLREKIENEMLEKFEGKKQFIESIQAQLFEKTRELENQKKELDSFREHEIQFIIQKTEEINKIKMDSAIVLQEKLKECECQIEEKMTKQFEGKKQFIESIQAQLFEKTRELENQKKELDSFREHEKQFIIQKTEEINKIKMDSTILLQEKLKECECQIEAKITKQFEEKAKYIQSIESQLFEKTRELENQKKELFELREREKEIVQQTIEEMKNKNTPKKIGEIGENVFYDLAIHTFRDFKQFQIKNTSKQKHSGDFHLSFENFTIMVDIKNYTNKVGSINRDKIKNDLINHPTIKIAWLISLETDNDKYSYYPFMIDDTEIENGICICYINSLLLQHNPTELLKIVWYTCEIIYENIINNQTNNEEMNKFKKNQQTIIKFSDTYFNEIKKKQETFINGLQDTYNTTTELINQLLKDTIQNYKDTEMNIVKEWWNINCFPSHGDKIKSSHIYDAFSNESPYKINSEKFKMILENIIDPLHIQRQKTKNSPFIILNHSIRKPIKSNSQMVIETI